MNRPLKSLASVAVAAGLAVAVAACSSGSSSSSASAAASTAAASSPAASSAPFYSELPASIKSKSKGEIVIGSSIDYPPFEYYAPNGTTLEGFETQLMAQVQKQLGVKFVWDNANFDTLFTSLDAGRYDVEFGATNDTAAREQKYDFVDYLISSQAFDTLPGKTGSIKSVTDVCGMKVAAITGGVQLAWLQSESKVCTSEGKPGIDALGFADNAGEQTAVLSGQANALLEGYATAVAFGDAKQGGRLALVPGIQVGKSYYGVAIPKANTQLVKAFMDAWNAVIASPAYKQILTAAGLANIGLAHAILNGATTAPQKQ